MSLRASAKRERGNPNTKICHTEQSEVSHFLESRVFGLFQSLNMTINRGYQTK
ncbi:hypothetical protein [Helicobacter sp. T3_23-1059]